MHHHDFIRKAALTTEGLQLLEDYKAAFKEWKPLSAGHNEVPKRTMHRAAERVKKSAISLWTVATFMGVDHTGFMGIIQQLENEAL